MAVFKRYPVVGLIVSLIGISTTLIMVNAPSHLQHFSALVLSGLIGIVVGVTALIMTARYIYTHL
ncbi:hypothetical protein ACFQDN_24995 [Pseudomonas asuensis]|uniref:Uncharacterized protein n=1 Tax=Pseudomonas asuensis TaxID=1825787 RepID=A0ABQ2GZM7_9PSED|nr:hypothetical protein [Pseudomonas asuensis]GGM19621.1 hypothetical protein GCM10009425_33150 [Pseudomonas asuensis]